MNSVAEVVLVLKLMTNMAPVAVYFIILGLVNSQSYIHVISARRDWLCLGIVFFPVMFWPVLWFAEAGMIFVSMLALILGTLLFVLFAPGRASGWVVYNCDRDTVRRQLLASLQAVGIECEQRGARIVAHGGQIELAISEFRLLKNVTVSIKGGGEALSSRLGAELERRLGRVNAVPSFSAAAMLVSGTVLLILPLVMMISRIDAFVKVVSDLIPV